MGSLLTFMLRLQLHGMHADLHEQQVEDIDAALGQRTVIAKITLKCQCCCCIGMAEFSDACVRDIGLINVSVL